MDNSPVKVFVNALIRSRIKPLDIRRIEHDHFIDYEVDFPIEKSALSLPLSKLLKTFTFQVEFVELPEEESEANESDNLVISHSESEDPGQQGGGGESLLEDSKVTFLESFAYKMNFQHVGLSLLEESESVLLKR